jgi:hypothetical protein
LLSLSEGFLHAQDVAPRRAVAAEPPGEVIVVPGLAASFTDDQSPRGAGGVSTKSLRILLVHGIGCHRTNWSAALQQRLAEDLGFWETSGDRNSPRYVIEYEMRDEIAHPAKHPGNTSQPANYFPLFTFTKDCASQFTLTDSDMPTLLVRHYIDGSGNELSFYEVTWSVITEKRRQNDFKSAATNGSSGAFLNLWAKRSVLDEKLSDTVMYLGYEKVNVLAVVKDAICRMWASPSPEKDCVLDDKTDVISKMREHRFSVIAESLGSRIVFDALSSSAFESFAREMLGSTDVIYMLANQIPLLELAGDPSSMKQPSVHREMLNTWLSLNRGMSCQQGDSECILKREDELQESLDADLKKTVDDARAGIYTQKLQQRIDATKDKLATLEGRLQEVYEQKAAKEKEILEIHRSAELQAVQDQRKPEAPGEDEEHQREERQAAAREREKLERERDKLGARALPILASINGDKIELANLEIQKKEAPPPGILTFDRLVLTSEAEIRREQAGQIEAALKQCDDQPPCPKMEKDLLGKQLAKLTKIQARQKLQIFAFSDPSDILSYELSSEFEARLKYVRFTNVPLPLSLNFFGLFANPVQAHSGYDRSARAARLIACGGKLFVKRNAVEAKCERRRADTKAEVSEPGGDGER